MAKTITLKDTSIQNITIENYQQPDNSIAGFSCTISYFVNDSEGKTALENRSMKYTKETENSGAILSDDSSKLVTDFVNAIKANMDAKEEL